MKTGRDHWVRVLDESELREGMAVQLRPCSQCRQTETFFLAGYGGVRSTLRSDGTTDAPEPGYFVIGRCAGTGIGTGIAPRSAIQSGRLYRLADDDLTGDAATTERTRERVTAR